MLKTVRDACTLADNALTIRVSDQIEQLDELRIDIQLMAVFAQAARDAEAESLASIGQSEGRVKARAHEAPTAAWAAFARTFHRIRPQKHRGL